jgi:hypothetical protein
MPVQFTNSKFREFKHNSSPAAVAFTRNQPIATGNNTISSPVMNLPPGNARRNNRWTAARNYLKRRAVQEVRAGINTRRMPRGENAALLSAAANEANARNIKREFNEQTSMAANAARRYGTADPSLVNTITRGGTRRRAFRRRHHKK